MAPTAIMGAAPGALPERASHTRKETGQKRLLQQNDLNMIPRHVKPVFMADAIALSNEPRLVICANAPHPIMHANRGWSRLTGSCAADIADRSFLDILNGLVIREGRRNQARDLLRCVRRHGRGSIRPLVRCADGDKPKRVRIRVIAVVRPAVRLQTDTLRIIAYLVTAEEISGDQLSPDSDAAFAKASAQGDLGEESYALRVHAPSPSGGSTTSGRSLSSSDDSSSSGSSTPPPDFHASRKRPRAARVKQVPQTGADAEKRPRTQAASKIRPMAIQKHADKEQRVSSSEDPISAVEGYRRVHRGLLNYYQEAGGYFDARSMPYADLDTVPGAHVLSQCGILSVNNEQSLHQATAATSLTAPEPWIVASAMDAERRPQPMNLEDYRPPTSLTIPCLMSRVADIYAALDRQYTRQRGRRVSTVEPLEAGESTPRRGALHTAASGAMMDEYLMSAWRARQDYLRGISREGAATVTDCASSEAVETTSSSSRSAVASRTSSTTIGAGHGDGALDDEDDDDEAYLSSDFDEEDFLSRAPSADEADGDDVDLTDGSGSLAG